MLSPHPTHPSPAQSEADAAAFAKAGGWAIEDKTAVAPLIPDNTPRPVAVFDEGIKYGDVQGLVNTLLAGK